jgi:alkylated DNA repair dioxygenase AlkB
MRSPSLFDSPSKIITSPNNILPFGGEALFFPGFFTKTDSDRLFDRLMNSTEWKQDKIRFYGKLIDLPRLTAWYGDIDKAYKYSGIPMNPLPWTESLLEIKTRIESVAKIRFSSVLLNQYRDGKDGVAWHCDDEPELGVNPTIGSVSFGSTRAFKLRSLTDKSIIEKIDLSHGSFLLMRGETQHKWEHEIPKTAKPTKTRINLTFRVIQ